MYNKHAKKIDFKNKRCKYIMILQDLKNIFQKSQNYSKKGLLVNLLHLVTKNLFSDKKTLIPTSGSLDSSVILPFSID